MSTDSTTYHTEAKCPECEAHFEVTQTQWLAVCKFTESHRVECPECDTPLRWNFEAGCFMPVAALTLNAKSNSESDLEPADRVEARLRLRDRKQVNYFNDRGELVVKCGLCGNETSAHGEVILTGRFTKRWSVVGYRLGHVYKPVEVKKFESMKSTPRVVCDSCARSEHAEPRKVHRLPVDDTKHFGRTEYYRPTGIDGRDGSKPDSDSELAWQKHDERKALTRTQLRREQRKLAKLRQYVQARSK